MRIFSTSLDQSTCPFPNGYLIVSSLVVAFVFVLIRPSRQLAAHFAHFAHFFLLFCHANDMQSECEGGERATCNRITLVQQRGKAKNKKRKCKRKQ